MQRFSVEISLWVPARFDGIRWVRSPGRVIVVVNGKAKYL